MWVYPIIGRCICVNNINVKETHPTRGTRSRALQYPHGGQRQTSLSSAYISPLFTRIRLPLPPVGMLFPFCHDPMSFGLFLLTESGVYSDPHIFSHSLFSRLCQRNTTPPPDMRCLQITVHGGALVPVGGGGRLYFSDIIY